MCGIAGFSLSGDTSRVDTDKLMKSLLLGIEHRGRDATGIAWGDEGDGQVWIQKDAVRASEFVPHLAMTNARAAIGHTRYGTKGSETNPLNNHPVENHGIVLTHNGVCFNDDEIFELLGDPERHGQVDSEAAAALVAYARDRLGEDPAELLTLLEGSAALAWLSVHDEPGTLHLARVASSPLYVAQTRRGSILYASTKPTLTEAAKAAGFKIRYINEIPEGSYLRIEHGSIAEVRRFDRPSRTAPARRRYYNPDGTRATPVKRATPAARSVGDSAYWPGTYEHGEGVVGSSWRGM